MSRAKLVNRLFTAFVIAVTVLFLAQQQAHGTGVLASLLTASWVGVFASLAKLVSQLAGSICAGLCAAHYERGNSARRCWMLMSAWLACWFAGQSVLVFYDRVLGVDAPVPSIGDAFFFAGYVFVLLALGGFVRAYRRSGFAVGSAGEDARIAVFVCAAFAVVAYLFLRPVAIASTPLAERIVNVGYPVSDLVTLIPAMVLLRITLGFRGGQVWRVWAALLAGIVFATGADVAFSDITPEHVAAVRSLVDLLSILGYAFCAFGAWLQYQLVAE